VPLRVESGHFPSSNVRDVERINGCTVIRPSEVAEANEPVRFGPSEMGGAYVVEAGVFAPGTSLPFHLHPNTDETFYVADGEARFKLGDRELQLGAGSMVFVPRGTPHTVSVSGSAPVRGLILISPGDVEHEFVPVDA
jgi:quercetin dioxygenase-like cupin family protein